MLSLPFGFHTNVRRSGHAACWCPALDGIVQFGGWPPSEELSRTIHQDGTNCPLYLLTAKELAKGVDRAGHAAAMGDGCGAHPELATSASPPPLPLQPQQPEASMRNGDTTTSGTAPTVAVGGRRANSIAEAALLAEDGGDGWRPKRRVWLLGMNPGADRDSTSGALRQPQLRQRISGAEGQSASAALGEHPRPHGARDSDDNDADSAVDSIHYDEGYLSEPSDFAGSQATPTSSSSSSSSGSSGSGSGGDPPPAVLDVESADGAVGRAVTSTAAAEAGGGRVVAPVVTAELLRALGSTMAEVGVPRAVGAAATTTASPAPSFYNDASSVSPAPTARTSHTAATGSNLPAALLASQRALRAGEQFREAHPITADAQPVAGKFDTRPLRWRTIREVVAPRTRHGHHLVHHDGCLYVMGGSYWAHGNALATSDMRYRIKANPRRLPHQGGTAGSTLSLGVWQQLDSLFPPRFCATVAESSAAVSAAVDAHDGETITQSSSSSQKVLYSFGGLDFNQQLTDTLHRLWLPSGACQELEQYGAAPPRQFKGIMVCDVSREVSVEVLRGASSGGGGGGGQSQKNPDHSYQQQKYPRPAGRLFYMDGFQDGRPMAPALRYYTLATGFWVKVCTCPDLVRGQVAGAWRRPPLVTKVRKENDVANRSIAPAVAAAGEGETPPPLLRFDVFGGMPSRRGKQRRSRVCYSFCAERQCYDYANPLPVPGLTAHVIVLLPARSQHCSGNSRSHRDHHHGPSADEESMWLRQLRDARGIVSVSCGGNEDLNGHEQNSLGEPVSWVYLLGRREITLAEQARVFIDSRKIPFKIMLAPEKDELLDKLF